MSLVVSSTTDSQEAVNAAAGLPEAGAAPAPAESTAPETAAEPTAPTPQTPEEPKAQEAQPESEEPGEEPEAPRKKGGFQRKIERYEQLMAQQAEYARYLEAQLAAQRPGEPPQPQAQPGPPREEDFPNGVYDPGYIRAVARWESRQELLEQQEVARKAAAEWQQQQERAAYEQKLAAFARTVDDFDERIASVRHIRFAKDINAAIQESEIGPQLAYELARKPEELMRLAKLPVRSAIREIGKFEAQLLSRSTNGSSRAPVAPSKAPPPINPVGGGGPLTTKDPGEMSFQEYKAHWRKTHPGRNY